MAALAGRVALVTGAARGIGLAIATGLAEAGANVILHDRDRAANDRALGELGARGLTVSGLVHDLADPAAPARMRAALTEAETSPDMLILCASIEILEGWDRISEAALAQQTEINLHATVRLIQAFLPGMIARGFGRIVAIGSVQETRPNPTHFYYAATKAAQTSMILNLARTLRAGGITCNVIKPGAVLTDRNRAVLADPAHGAAVLERIPLRRLGAPQDCVGAALLLCSPEGAYINGAEIAVDGGLRL
jgi:NAD(P)-dependent dehydrogenase (short-subunit alcohol dehydrogenase family)